MRLFVPALVLAACGAPARPPAPGVEHAEDPPAIEDPQIARWRSLALTGADHEAKLAALDVDDETRAGMARALLLGGNLACHDIVEHSECGVIVKEMLPLPPTATFDDPCLRRVLALWAVQQLGPEDAEALAPALIAMAAIPDPELELQDAAFGLVPEDADDLRLQMMEVTDMARAEDQVTWLADLSAVAHAATAMHLTSAVLRLAAEDPGGYHTTLTAALADEQIGADVRMTLILETFATSNDQATLDAIASVVTDADDCSLAELAAENLADRGDKTKLPARPKSADTYAHIRALCMLSRSGIADRDTRLRAWIGPKGLDEIDSYDDVYWQEDPTHVGDNDTFSRDGDVTVETHRGMTTTTTHVAVEDVDVEALVRPFQERYFVSSWSCNEAQCVAPLVMVQFTKASKSLVVKAVELESYSGDDC